MKKIITASKGHATYNLGLKEIRENVCDNLLKAQHTWGEREYFVSDKNMAKAIMKLDTVKIVKEGKQWKVTDINGRI